MSETDTFVSQEAPSSVGVGTIDLERCKALLRLLAVPSNAGIAADEFGRRCLYCDWSHEDYRAEPQHDEDCPIRKARKLLRGG